MKRHDQDDDDIITVYAIDERQAAEKWAEHDDMYGEYHIAAGEYVKVFVRNKEDEWLPFTVSGEYTPTYYSNEGHDD